MKRSRRHVLHLIAAAVALVAPLTAQAETYPAHPARIIVAVPVGAPETCEQFENEVDEVVCGKRPEDLGAVGAWYEDFTQTTDEEVCELLDRIALAYH